MQEIGRDYAGIVAAVKAAEFSDGREARMRTVVDILWDHLSAKGVSWVGFYLHEAGEELILGPSRDKPACSPIGMHGACGQAFLKAEPLVVRNVEELCEGYIACDPYDRSEVVLPLREATGRSYAVLDLDSHDIGAFDHRDVVGLQDVLETAGLTI